jgi:transposase
VVIAMAVTRNGIPVRCWTFPGSESDQRIIGTIKDDRGAWNLHRLMWCADAGFASAANRAYLTRSGGHYILATFLQSRGSARRLPCRLPVRSPQLHRRHNPHETRWEIT